jgi:hypothetical protein
MGGCSWASSFVEVAARAQVVDDHAQTLEDTPRTWPGVYALKHHLVDAEMSQSLRHPVSREGCRRDVTMD